MGPQPSSRGNMASPFGRKRENPLQWGRNLPVAEMQEIAVHADNDTLASMGPQPSSRGNHSKMRDVYAEFHELQWGRNLPVAEIAALDALTLTIGSLQWGRNLPVAEISEYELAQYAGDELQWGRNLPVAEITDALCGWCMEPVLQWGRNLPVAEMRRASQRVEHYGLASMGPQPSSRGNAGLVDTAMRYGWTLQWGRNLPVAEMK